jgi:hypothetical protein
LLDAYRDNGGGVSAAAPTPTAAQDSSTLDAPEARAGSADRTGDAARAAQPATGPANAALDPSPKGASDAFVLAVSPLQHASMDPTAQSITEGIYAEVLRQLRAIPNVVVVDVAFERRVAPIAVVSSANDGAAPNVFPNPAFGNGTATGTAAPSAAFETVVVARDDITAPPGLLAEGSFVPTALVNRIEVVTGGASSVYGEDATAGIANMILDRNVQGMRLETQGMRLDTVQVRSAGGNGAADNGADAATATRAGNSEEPKSPAFDYRLDFEATSVADPSAGGVRNRWIFSTRGTGDGHVPWSASSSASVSVPVDASTVAAFVVEPLRRSVLPADEARTAELASRALDATLTTSARLAALDQLQEFGQRTGADGRTNEVIRGALDLTAAAASPAERARVWQLLRGTKNANLVQPLLDAFRDEADDNVRLEAARTLAADFADEGSVRAMLEQAAYLDDSAEVRLEATWAIRDAEGRNRYVGDALLDGSMSDAERLAPLVFALDRGTGAGDGTAEYAQGVDDAAAAALIEILRRTAAPARKSLLLTQLSRVEHPALTRFFADVLRDDSNEQIRFAAAMALRQHLDEPSVRAALQRARGYDESPRVREAATRVLE